MQEERTDFGVGIANIMMWPLAFWSWYMGFQNVGNIDLMMPYMMLALMMPYMMLALMCIANYSGWQSYLEEKYEFIGYGGN